MTQTLTKIGENVWIWPHELEADKVQSAVGVVVGLEETVLVDAGNGPGLGREIAAELVERGFPRVGRIIYTHHHWDHVYGASAFEGATVVAHQKCREILMVEAKKPWSSAYLKQEIERNPKLEISYTAQDRAVGDWEDFRIVVPDVVFDSTMVIELENGRIELEHIGGDHAEDSIVVKLPEERIMFLGDCFYPPPYHLLKGGETVSFSMLARLAQEDYDLFVEGHDRPFTKGELLAFLEGKN
jgi:glyoxylase-like metal-dependent hydrolase (beta-lactamase superfamily II)